MEEYQLKAGNYVTSEYQKKREAYEAKKMASVNTWVKYEMAARRIQKAYISWRRPSLLFKNKTMTSSFMDKKSSIMRQHTVVIPNTIHSFNRILTGRASFSEYMTLWRAVADFRRLYPAHATDLIVKTLIEAGGDVGKTTNLLGSQEYCLKHQSDLPVKLKELFLPPVTISKGGALSSAQSVAIGAIDDTLHSAAVGAASAMHGSKMDLIRTLRERQRQLKRSELLEVLSSTIATSYFSKHHYGTKNHHTLQKAVNKASSVKLKYQMLRSVELSSSIHCLTAERKKKK